MRKRSLSARNDLLSEPWTAAIITATPPTANIDCDGLLSVLIPSKKERGATMFVAPR